MINHNTPPKINIEPENGGLEDDFPLPGGPYSQVPAVNVPGCNPLLPYFNFLEMAQWDWYPGAPWIPIYFFISQSCLQCRIWVDSYKVGVLSHTPYIKNTWPKWEIHVNVNCLIRYVNHQLQPKWTLDCAAESINSLLLGMVIHL